MISAYEVALLCDRAYRDDSAVVPMSHLLVNSDLSEWGEEAHEGVSNSFFCTKYIKTRTRENVIAFRGTGGRPADVGVDLTHTFSRNSPYITAARQFVSRYGDNNTIVVGHSLGGFIAITMAFHFRGLKVAAINPPWMAGIAGALAGIIGGSAASVLGLRAGVRAARADQRNANRSPNFQSAKIIVYQSSSDVVTGLTHGSRIESDNLRFIRIGCVGWHNMDPIIADFRQNRRYPISW